MTKTKLNIAMIGSGFMGKVHSNAFRQVGHFFDLPYELHLSVICGRNREKLEASAARWGWEEIQTDWHEIVNRKDVDVIDVAVPNALHGPIAIAAAKAGKIVLCEKPLATSLAEAESMTQAIGSLPNLVWFNYRRVPAVAFAKQLIQEGKIGRTYHYRAQYLNQSGNDPSKASGWRYKHSEAGSGAAGDLLSHSIDLALYLNGPITELTAMTHTFAEGRDVDDAALLLARFANGSIGSFEVSRYGVGCQNRNAFEINGSQGMLGFSLEDMNRLDFYDATEDPSLRGCKTIMVTGTNHPYWETFWKPAHALGYEHPFIATLGDFLLAMARKETFHVNFQDALEVQRVLDAVERSAQTRDWVMVDTATV
jgi:myo-inositol 2-dehydrogenase/D-chiro-inositol 1-dehydrogenase